MGNNNTKKTDNVYKTGYDPTKERRHVFVGHSNYPPSSGYASFSTSHTRNVNHNAQSNVNLPQKIQSNHNAQSNVNLPPKIHSDCNAQSNVNFPPKMHSDHSGLHSERTHQDLRSNHAVYVQTDTKVATVTDKEKYSNNQTMKHDETAVSPPQILTQDDFKTDWFSWKEIFLTYMKSIDPAEQNKDKWCIMLLNRMGPVGQEIYKTFTFENSCEKEDINKLLKKFDMLCVFGNFTSEDADEPDIFVNALMVMASKHMIDKDKIVKEKILMEMDINKFRQKVGNLIPGFSYPSGVQWLTVREMAYIWMSYENFDFKREQKIVHNEVKNCVYCGSTHALNRCRAYNKSCTKCGIGGHLFYRCPSQFSNDCKWCGESHFFRQCPAYGNICHKCQKQNHFSWKCSFRKLLQCKFCNVLHYASVSCPYKNY